jgi:2-keto-4-pentenoate hydratase
MKTFKGSGFFLSFFLSMYLLLGLGFPPAGAADFADTLTENFLNKTPVTRVDSELTIAQALKVQDRFVANLIKEFGQPVGYKAGLTNPAIQKRLGIDHPVRGTILARMILKSGTAVPAAYGSVPVIEGDFCVRVSGDGINQAKTPEETLKYLDAVIPAFELADLMFGKEVKLTPSLIVAINVGPRYFVLGEPIPLSATKEWEGRLGTFKMNLSDQTGAVLGEGTGSDLSGHPLKAVLWIRDSLAAEGKTLKKGDLLSLGSLSKMIPSKAGTTLKARYLGLNPEGPVEITVTLK